ncbi:hypothetical protein [Pseudomonas sp. NFX15]|uniref:hypothetical protein n=1 Tax=Pseudomonas sp. NFX15 TaxID=2816958 RepID=UPI003B8CBAB0
MGRATDSNGGFGSILLKKSVSPDGSPADRWKRLLCTSLREIWAPTPLLKVKISITRAYFSAEKTMADFFNRIGQSLPVVTSRNRPKAVYRMSKGQPKIAYW